MEFSIVISEIINFGTYRLFQNSSAAAVVHGQHICIFFIFSSRFLFSVSHLRSVNWRDQKIAIITCTIAITEVPS